MANKQALAVLIWIRNLTKLLFDHEEQTNSVDKFDKPKSTAKRIQAQDTRDCGHMFCSKEHAQ